MEKVIHIKGGRSLIVRAKPIEAMKTGVLEEPVQTQLMQPVQFIPSYPAPSYQSYHPQTEGVAIPDIKTEKQTAANEEEIQRVNMQYPLIPANPVKGEKVFAYAHIFFDRRTGELVYEVVEPSLGENARLLTAIKEYIEEKLDINFAQIRKGDAINYLNVVFSKALTYFNAKLDKETTDILRYYVVRDFIGLEKIEPLMQDKFIEDISCDGVNIPIFVYHRLPQFGSVKTSVVFKTGDELDSFVNKLAERCGRSISVAKPLLDGTLPNGSRLQATLGSDIARNGSNFTIRMFSDKPMTPVDTIKFGTSDLKMMAYFWFLVEHGSSVLISGGTASGKTSLLNVLSLFIKPQMKIISIEDTSEIRLPHSHWVPEVARTPISEEGKVDMFELLRESLRQRPDYIIVGEVRGKEAYVLFQQMAVGHPGLSTIHAENFQKLVDRMTSPPINLPANLMENLDLILFLKRVKQGRKYNRRIFSAVEVTGYDQNTKSPLTNELFSWNARNDEYVTQNSSAQLKKIQGITGLTDEQIGKELENRAKVLKWMVNKNITDYRKIASIISMYYLSPDFLLGRIAGEV
ncbi:MAG: type II/IV secretion system ATPase subunit [Candidatus Aenigmarchaeota archaeon]|nr:type II/IV secretion system ATPase subunit [Candidatus Aenigmarchaeota archaeon]